jgi:hypothetical protein
MCWTFCAVMTARVQRESPLHSCEAVDRRIWMIRTGEGVKLMEQLHHAAQSRDHALPG